MAVSQTLDPTQVQGLRDSLQGQLIEPHHDEYNAARTVWNGMIDRSPALIARCASVADVQAAVRFARTNGLHPAVRGGGHNAAGLAVSEGGLVIDLSPMRDVQVDPERRIARAQG